MRRIYVDLDDVLAETGRMLLRLLDLEFGRAVAFDDIHSYDLGDSFGLPADELDEFMHRAHQPEALRDIEPMLGARETLTLWRESGYEVFVVTGRPATTLTTTVDWLRGLKIPYAELHFMDKFSNVYRGGTSSGDTLTLADLPRLDFCLAVEDFPGTSLHLANELGVPVALFDRPWNRTVSARTAGDSQRMVRCRDWGEIRRRFPAP